MYRNDNLDLFLEKMADEFLSQLPVIEKETLHDDTECTICFTEFGTSVNGSSIEYPLQLPCTHIMGSECIRTWLSSSKEGKKTCPHCRRVLFIRPKLERGFLRNSTHRDVDLLILLLRLWGYVMREDGLEWINRDDLLEREIKLLRMRAYLDATVPGFKGSATRRSMLTDFSYLHSQPDGRAAAIMTTPLRESALYLQLQSRGASLPPIPTPLNGLTKDQKEALFEKINRLGAFDTYPDFNKSPESSNKMMWKLLRRKGEVCRIFWLRGGEIRIAWFAY